MARDDDKDEDFQGLSTEELHLLHAMMKDVKAFDGKSVPLPALKKPKTEQKPPKIEPVLKKTGVKQVQKQSQGFEGGLDKRTDERLRRGQMPIEATLDLHGMTYDQGKEAFERFIQDAYGRGKRCVLVITGRGKGKTSDEDWLAPKPGVLKRSVPEWMKDEALCTLILKHYPARPRDGGDGALYVLLRRRRDID